VGPYTTTAAEDVEPRHCRAHAAEEEKPRTMRNMTVEGRHEGLHQHVVRVCHIHRRRTVGRQPHELTPRFCELTHLVKPGLVKAVGLPARPGVGAFRLDKHSRAHGGARGCDSRMGGCVSTKAKPKQGAARPPSSTTLDGPKVTTGPLTQHEYNTRILTSSTSKIIQVLEGATHRLGTFSVSDDRYI
jgi:hypothetical protein